MKINSVSTQAGFLAVFSLAFFSFWWNSIFPPSIGGELLHFELHSRGQLPYRDFFQNVPPGCNFIGIAMGSLFGGKFLPFLALGVLIRTAATVCCFLLLRRAFRPTTAVFAAAVTLVVSSIDRADHPAFYNHLAGACVLFAATALTEALLRRKAWAGVLLAAVAGVFLGCSVLIKHTVGVAATLCLLFLLVLSLIRGKGGFRRYELGLGALAGLAVPLGGLWYWLGENGLTALFWEQLFHTGPASKGGLSAFSRPLVSAVQHPQFGAPALAGALALVAAVIILRVRRADTEAATPSSTVVPLCGGLALVAMLLVGFHVHAWSIHSIYLSLCYLVLLATALLSLRGIRDLYRAPLDDTATPVAFASAAGFSVAYSFSISWPAFEMMLFPGLALLICIILDRPADRPLQGQVRAVVFTFCLALLGFACWQKATYPYSWGRWMEPAVRFAMVEPKVEQLRGFVLSPTTARFWEWAVESANKYTKPTDKIYAYPNLPAVYAITRRMPCTFLSSHWVDITPDDVAISDAKLLLSSPPAMMFIHDDAAGELEREETLFRGGRTSGTRAIRAALARLKKTRFVFKGKFPVYGSYTPIEIWVRRPSLSR